MEHLKKVGRIQLLIILVLISVFILLFPIPMSRSKEELYMTTETYYDEIPQVVNESISVPYQVTKTANWSVTWYILTVNKQWGPSIGTDTWYSPTFLVDWGYGAVYGNYSDGVGFIISTSTYVETPGIYTFTLGSDDGSRLYLDGNLVIDNWRDQYYTQYDAKRWLTPGWHSLSISYYEYLNAAKVYFDVDKGNFFTWEETQYMTIQVPRIQVEQIPKQRVTVANRTVTEPVYESILEYLMKGGKP